MHLYLLSPNRFLEVKLLYKATQIFLTLHSSDMIEFQLNIALCKERATCILRLLMHMATLLFQKLYQFIFPLATCGTFQVNLNLDDVIFKIFDNLRGKNIISNL